MTMIRCAQYYHPWLVPQRPAFVASADDGAEAKIARALCVELPSTIDEVVAVSLRLTLARDPALWEHQRNVAEYAVILAEALDWSPEAVAGVRAAGSVHDLGKLALSAEILSKPGPLTAAEFAQVREHPAVGCRLLTAVDMPAALVTMVRDHHERWDGMGYAFGQAGGAISPGGRILAVADTLDAMLQDRPYAAGRPFVAAIAEIDRCAGQQFDPTVVAALRRVVALHSPTYFRAEMQALPLPQR